MFLEIPIISPPFLQNITEKQKNLHFIENSVDNLQNAYYDTEYLQNVEVKERR